MLFDSELKYMSDKIHVHRWPQDSPIWDDLTQNQLDVSINKNQDKKQVIIKEKIIKIENYEFNFSKKNWNICTFF